MASRKPICPSCSSTIPPEAQFCPNCGHALAASEPEKSTEDRDRQNLESAPEDKPTSYNRKSLLIAAAILTVGTVVVCIVSGIVMLSSRNRIATARQPTPTLDLNPVFTSAAETLLASFSPTVPPQTATPPTLSIPPTPIPLYLPSNTPPPPPVAFTSTRSSKGQWIAFHSADGGNYDIYLIDIHSDNLVKLTNAASQDHYPSWSPDGRYIAYQTDADGDYELAIINVATRRVSVITDNSCPDWAPSWSPDGEWIAFHSSCSDVERNIYKIRPDGSERQQLTFGSNVYNWFPSWSPDGKKITFSSNRSGRYQIFIMNADGSDQISLANGCVSSFSPDGKQILYGMYCLDTDDLFLERIR